MKPKNQFLQWHEQFYRCDKDLHKLLDKMNDMTERVASDEVANLVSRMNALRQYMVQRLKQATNAMLVKLGMSNHIHEWQFVPMLGDVVDGKKFWLVEAIVDGKKRDLGSLSNPSGDLGIFKAMFYDGFVAIPLTWLDDISQTERDILVEQFLLKRYSELKREAKSMSKPLRALKAALRTLETIDLSK